MFQVGEVVAYGATGVCTIDDVRLMSMSRSGAKKQEYYVLRPVSAPTCLTYVPTASPLAEKMRPVLKREEADAMLSEVGAQPLDWIEDARQRADVFGAIVSGGLTVDLLRLIGCLYTEKRTCSGRGRRFSTADDRLLTSAERVVCEEFAYCLQIPAEKVTAYIAKQLNQTI